MVTAFAGRLKEAVDLDMIRDDLATLVEKALAGAHSHLVVNERTWVKSRL